MTDLSAPSPTLSSGSSGRLDLRLGTLLPWILAAVTVLFLVLFLAYPIAMSLLQSFVLKGSPLAFDNLTLENFARFVTSGMYRRALWNTIWISGIATLLASAIAIPTAYVVARVDIGLRNFIMALSIVPLISPPSSAPIPGSCCSAAAASSPTISTPGSVSGCRRSTVRSASSWG